MAPLCLVLTFIARRQMKPYDWQCYQKEPHDMGKGSLPGKKKVQSREKQNKVH